MSKHIIPLLPEHKIYAEPFCGSAAMLFAKGIPDNIFATGSYREVINDTNQFVVNFFRVLQNKDLFDELNHRIIYTPYSYVEYQKAVDILKNQSESASQIELAWAFFYSINNSFANKLNGGWMTSKLSSNNAQTHYVRSLKLTDVRERFKLVYIDNRDAVKFIEKWDSPETCFYVDPPYPDTAQGHYSGYTQQDFEHLLATLNGIQGKFVLSCYDNPAVPDYWERHHFDSVALSTGKTRNSKHTDHSGSKRTECVWVKK